jgi:hypothetical protein
VITRDLPDGTSLVMLQEDHADVAAQFAAHWGNDRFARLDPYRTMVFGTIYHDSGHREMEADLPIDVEKGLPYALGRTPVGIRKREADVVNCQWIGSREPYAGLVVSMHHAGLRKRRYDTVGRADGQKAPDGQHLGIDDAFNDLEDWQKKLAKQVELDDPRARADFWHNYRCLQVFDILSLYFCWDGYDGDRFKDVTVEKVPVRYGSDETVDLQLVPTGPTSVRMTPYPFDIPKLPISVMVRPMAPLVDKPEPITQEAFYKARRLPLTWEISG